MSEHEGPCYDFDMTRLICCVFLLSYSAVSAEPMTKMVDGNESDGKRLQCKAYLSAPAKNENGKMKLFFSISGTGVYTTYFDHNKNADYYYLSFDKPGIMPGNNAQSKPKIDRSSFDLYTIDSLLDCAQNALNWGYDQLNNQQIEIVLQGHSEGSLVVINLAKRIMSDNKRHFDKKVKALFLSGVVTKNMRDIVDAQFTDSDRKNLEKAYKKHDSDFLISTWGIGWHWADQILQKKFSRLVEFSALCDDERTRALPIEIFQGLFDTDTPTKEVQSFEKQNRAKVKNKQLNLRARYYSAPHGLNESALVDVDALRDYYFGDRQSSHVILR